MIGRRQCDDMHTCSKSLAVTSTSTLEIASLFRGASPSNPLSSFQGPRASGEKMLRAPPTPLELHENRHGTGHAPASAPVV